MNDIVDEEIKKIELDSIKEEMENIKDEILSQHVDFDQEINEREGERSSTIISANINSSYEKSSNKKLKSKILKNKNIETDAYLNLIEKCVEITNESFISFRFHFMDGKEKLKLFHLKIFLFIKNYLEKVIKSHSYFGNRHFAIDNYVFVTKLKGKTLGSAFIHKYINCEDSSNIIPTKTIIKINSNLLSSNPKDKENIKFTDTIFHEIIHCLGFGHWNLLDNPVGNYDNGNIFVKNLVKIDKTTRYYQELFGLDSDGFGVPLSVDGVHFHQYNKPVLKNHKLIGILPSLKNELLTDSNNGVNVFTVLSASILEQLGYEINYDFVDKYPIETLPKKTFIAYSKTIKDHFAYNHEKYMLLLEYNKKCLTGKDIYGVKEGESYEIINKHSYNFFVVSKLDAEDKYLLGENEGIYTKNNDKIVIIPNEKTPNVFYLVSSITFGGIPFCKIKNDVTFENCYNENGLRYLLHQI